MGHKALEQVRLHHAVSYLCAFAMTLSPAWNSLLAHLANSSSVFEDSARVNPHLGSFLSPVSSPAKGEHTLFSASNMPWFPINASSIPFLCLSHLLGCELLELGCLVHCLPKQVAICIRIVIMKMLVCAHGRSNPCPGRFLLYL